MVERETWEGGDEQVGQDSEVKEIRRIAMIKNYSATSRLLEVRTGILHYNSLLMISYGKSVIHGCVCVIVGDS